MLIGNKIHHFNSIGSTSEYAKNIIGGSPEGTVVLAEQQTDGKGRSGKAWYSPAGGIWMSVILRPKALSLVPIAAAVAVCETLYTHGILAGIKWPNDILMNRKKVGGILTEIVGEHVVLGIGLNLTMRTFPSELRMIATSVALETNRHLDKKMIFELLCKHLDDCYIMLQRGRSSEILDQWRHYTILLGQNVIIDMIDRKISGKVLDIDRDGGLVIMQPDGKICCVISGVCRLPQLV